MGLIRKYFDLVSFLLLPGNALGFVYQKKRIYSNVNMEPASLASFDKPLALTDPFSMRATGIQQKVVQTFSCVFTSYIAYLNEMTLEMKVLPRS